MVTSAADTVRRRDCTAVTTLKSGAISPREVPPSDDDNLRPPIRVMLACAVGYFVRRESASVGLCRQGRDGGVPVMRVRGLGPVDMADARVKARATTVW
eukprot:2920194-Rhodomonas_salina.2